jgi:hypothetical protein
VLGCARQAGIDALDLHPALHEIAQTDEQHYERLWM